MSGQQAGGDGTVSGQQAGGDGTVSGQQAGGDGTVILRQAGAAAGRVLARDPSVVMVDDVATDAQCAHVVACATDRIRRAEVSADAGSAVSAGRSGGTCWLPHDHDAVVAGLARRIADVVGMALTHAENLQVVHYAPGQQYRPHFDAYDLSTPRGRRCCRRGGQRLVTALLYLNDVPEGGATDFPRLGVQVAPRRGRLAVFANTGTDASVPHPASLHAGAPVVRGEKWAVNLWFRARPLAEVAPPA